MQRNVAASTSDEALSSLRIHTQLLLITLFKVSPINKNNRKLRNAKQVLKLRQHNQHRRIKENLSFKSSTLRFTMKRVSKMEIKFPFDSTLKSMEEVIKEI
ncbi:CLUMA_CG014528, isoform A [Clunio marinus]|uniref:CLUMA_CG014528, isoform A n=1 Tax=Clunio marinus TaxID=568069 RepID=A0A1J1INS7_9DIPT|nr:CLUMA_CG014528, isoform A [Clunio marinus]